MDKCQKVISISKKNQVIEYCADEIYKDDLCRFHYHFKQSKINSEIENAISMLKKHGYKVSIELKSIESETK